MERAGVPPKGCPLRRAQAHVIEFDSTLGYPGEGPTVEVEVVGWNCGGIRDETTQKLHRLVQWTYSRSKGPHVILLQEHHLKKEQCRDAEMQLRQHGVESKFTPRDDDTASRGTAVIISVAKFGVSREGVKFDGGENGTITTASVKTPDRTYKYASIYLPSDAAERAITIQNIINNGWIKQDMTIEADHNMVEDVSVETEGSGRYDNAGHQAWFGHLAGKGLHDVERENAGPNAGLFTRRGGTRKSRLDKFMMPEGESFHRGWQWAVTNEPEITPFKSDHDPIVARLKIPETREFGRKKLFINTDLLDEQWFRIKLTDAYNEMYRQVPTAQHGHATVWALWKRKLAQIWGAESVLRRDQNDGEIAKWRGVYEAWLRKEKRKPPGVQRYPEVGKRIKLKLKEANEKARRVNFRRLQELSTKEFYRKYRVPQGLQWIEKLEITKDWENDPERKEGETTNKDGLLREATRYYEWLFDEKESEDEAAEELLKTLDGRTLRPGEAGRCEGDITVKEIFKVMRNLPRNKSPGPDGIPNEYYKTFAKLISDELTNVLNESHRGGRLHQSTKEGTISVLYKKKDRKDIRNYRPITLLNGDYKILTRTLCKRMKKVVGKIICKENTGFSPGRFIAENTHQMKIMQKMLEEEDTEGMFVFLDLEKAFDRVSWKYLKQAIQRLGFGPDFQRWIQILYDENDNPTRRLKINGHMGEQFKLKCGTAQGCPLSPLLYLCVMEAFSRTVNADKKVRGIKVGKAEFKLSQFADDTVLMLRDYRSINRVWKILEKVSRATGQRVNTNKTEGLLLGSLRGDARAPGWIKWCKDGEYIISLGVPFGNGFDGSQKEKDFWKQIYYKTKTIMARWSSVFSLTLRGRVMVANSMVYSRFRYWTQVMMMPEEIIDWLEEDVHELIWAKDPLFESGQEGQDQQAKRKIKEGAAKLAWRKGGIGMLDWREHLKSLRKKWAVRYLNHERGAWKEALDWFVCMGNTIGRGILMGTGSLPTGPNAFWDAVMEDFRDLKPERTRTGYEDAKEAMEEPIWESRGLIQKPQMKYQGEWEEELGVRQVKDWINRGANRTYTGGRWLRWARAGGGIGEFGGRTKFEEDHKRIEAAIDDEIQLIRAEGRDSWEKNEIVGYYDEEGTLKLGQIKRPAYPHLVQEVSLSTNGEAIKEGRLINIPAQAYDERGQKTTGPPVWKTRWIQTKAQDQKSAKQETSMRYAEEETEVTAFDGIAGITYPRINNYGARVNGEVTPLTELAVRDMTRDAVDKTTQRPTCEAANRWPVELQLGQGERIDFEQVWDTFKVGIATPVDFGTRFRMIHGDLGTRNKLGEPGGCRLGCGCQTEKHVHLVECVRLQPMWQKLISILEKLRGKRFMRWKQAVILGWTTEEGAIEKGSTALMSMLLKIIVIEWTRMLRHQTDFDYRKVWRIFWSRAERQWKETAKDKEYELRNIHQRGSDAKSTWRGIRKQLAPLGSIELTTCKVTCKVDWRKHEEY